MSLYISLEQLVCLTKLLQGKEIGVQVSQRVYTLLFLIPTYGRAKAGRPARTYIQQLCENTGSSPEDLPEALNDREKWRERVRDIRASSTT